MSAAGPAVHPPADEIAIAMLCGVAPMLETTLIGLLSQPEGLTGYISLDSSASSSPGSGRRADRVDFLVLVRSGRPQAALLERLAECHVPPAAIRWQPTEITAAWDSVADNVEMLVGLLNVQEDARHIGAARRADRRAA